MIRDKSLQIFLTDNMLIGPVVLLESVLLISLEISPYRAKDMTNFVLCEKGGGVSGMEWSIWPECRVKSSLQIALLCHSCNNFRTIYDSWH